MVQYLIVITKKGKAIKVACKDFPIQLRGGVGIKAMAVREGDEVVTATVIEE